MTLFFGAAISCFHMATLQYRPAIDGLRALAIMSVFIFHLNHEWLPGGFVGVDVFFVISGFLITSVILNELGNNSFSLSSFYQRRIARILPAFFFAALGTLGICSFIYSAKDLSNAGDSFLVASLSIANLKFMLEGNYFEKVSDDHPFEHYWSLSVEEQFYVFLPLLLAMLFRFAKKWQTIGISTLMIGSFIACVVMTKLKPIWAFYLLPTRAWELLAGCVLATFMNSFKAGRTISWPCWAPTAGLVTILASFFLVGHSVQFPGYLALFPVVGAICVLLPSGKSMGLCDRVLTAAPMVLIGRISYSLYLWHWPIFSLVDYKMYLSSETTRLVLKVCLSIFAAVFSFLFIEKPARVFLNRPRNMAIAFGLVVVSLSICAPLGITVKNANYVNAKPKDVANGGLIWGSNEKARSIVLMGDSFGSMYASDLREISKAAGAKLTVISVNAGDPLPHTKGDPNPLWLNSLEVVSKEKPDCLVIACRWEWQLFANKERLEIAIMSLRHLAKRIVILNQPPILPEGANRAGMRNGTRPPFFEDRSTRLRRIEINEYLNRFISSDVSVIDVSGYFEKSNREILCFDEEGRQLYHDAAHLSGYGTALIRPDLSRALLIISKPEQKR